MRVANFLDYLSNIQSDMAPRVFLVQCNIVSMFVNTDTTVNESIPKPESVPLQSHATTLSGANAACHLPEIVHPYLTFLLLLHVAPFNQ